MIIYVYIRTIKHLKVRLSHSFSVGDCKWSQRFRVSIPKCTRPSWGAIVNRCTSQMRDHAVTHPTLIPWSSSIRSYRRVLYKACDVEGFRKEVVLFKDLSQQFPSCSIHSCQTKPSSTVKTKSIGHANLKFVGAVTLSPASWQVRHRYSPGFVFEHCGVWRPKDFMVTLSGFNRVLHFCLGLRNHSNVELRLDWHHDRSMCMGVFLLIIQDNYCLLHAV